MSVICRACDSAGSWRTIAIIGPVCESCFAKLDAPTLLEGAITGTSHRQLCEVNEQEFVKQCQRLKRVAREILQLKDDTKTFVTGAVRSSDADATAYTLISPVAIRRVAMTCREGAVKYGDYNWEKGMPVREMLEHGIKHIFQYLDGDRSEDHLAHAAWNLLGAIHSEERWPELNKDLRPAKPT